MMIMTDEEKEIETEDNPFSKLIEKISNNRKVLLNTSHDGLGGSKGNIILK